VGCSLLNGPTMKLAEGNDAPPMEAEMGHLVGELRPVREAAAARCQSRIEATSTPQSMCLV